MNLFLTTKQFCGVAACLLALSAPPAGAQDQGDYTATDAELESVDARFQQFSAHFYAKLVRFDKYTKIDTLDTLAQTVEDHRKQSRPIEATATVISNLALVERSVDATPIIRISGLLLETNEWNTASRLISKVRAQGDRSLVANVSLPMAEYYFSRNQWKKTLDIVESIRSDIPAEDYHHALLMHGISLQRLQKHREALEHYAKIPKTSRYYAAARLNMAVANIRQDWWTDAHIIIHDLIEDPGPVRNAALTDRLYTVLGYSLLHQQYFRNSRDAFRNVSLDGPYTNKALLGIALTAAYQEDYIGALNAIKILRDRKTHDLPADEANLLAPYFYEKLKQPATASAGYTEAIQYYQNRSNAIKNAMQVDVESLNKQLISADSTNVSSNGESMDLGEKLPKFFFDNARMLARFQPHVNRMGDATLLREYSALNHEYKKLLHKAAQAILSEKASYITHYMNQSRYGLARMQDNDVSVAQ